MIIFEPKEHLEVETPKGIGRIWLVTEYGSEIEKIFTVIINENGEFWEFKNSQLKATLNRTIVGFKKTENKSYRGSRTKKEKLSKRK